MDLDQAMQRLNVASASIALISGNRVAWTRAYGAASNDTIYQAASLSKVVTAVAALRLVQDGRLGLDRDVNRELRSWRVPPNAMTRRHPVTLRGLLSMTAGVNVPGYIGYEPGSPVPDLLQILNGTPPAISDPVRVVRVPGTAHAYSGGGYEIVQALVQDATGLPFAEAVGRFVLKPAGMADSFYGPPRGRWRDRVALGHRADGTELRGGWRVMPELAAGGGFFLAGIRPL